MLIPKIGEIRAVISGYLITAVFYVGLAFAGAGWVVYLMIAVGSLGGIAGPALQGILSNQVPNNEQGELQSAVTSTMSLAAIFGPLIMSTWLFGVFAAEDAPIYFPGMPFIAAAILTVGSIIPFLLVMGRIKKVQPSAAE